MGQKITLSTKNRVHRAVEISAEYLLNIMPLEREESDRTSTALFFTQGLLEFGSFTGGSVVRGLQTNEERTQGYIVHDSTFSTITTGGTRTSEGTLTTSTGSVSMAVGVNQVAIADGSSSTSGRFYNYTTDTFSSITDTDYPALVQVIYLSTFFIGINGTGQVFISAPDDVNDWDPLDVATAETKPDNIISLARRRDDLMLIGSSTTEWWYRSDDTFPFDRQQIAHWGSAARFSVAEHAGVNFWLGQTKDGKVSIVANGDGYSIDPISTPDFDKVLYNTATKSDAIGYVFTEEGQTFYDIIFPTENKSYRMDIRTGKHCEIQRAGGGRFRANCHMNLGGKNIIGNYATGELYDMDWDYLDDVGTAYTRQIITPHVWAEGNFICCPHLEVDAEEGVGNGSTANPSLTLSVSYDSGHTYSTGWSSSLGTASSFTNRCRYRRLGRGRTLTFKFDFTTANKLVILGITGDFTIGGR